MTDEMTVHVGQTILALDAPELNHEVAQTKRQIELTRLQLDRVAGDPADLSNRMVLEGELARHRTTLAGLEAEQQRLIVIAPHDGTARDVDQDLQAGEWIDVDTPIARIVDSAWTEVQGYLSENDIWRVNGGADIVFVPEDPSLARRQGRVVEVVQTGIKAVELPYLASVYGGAVASDKNAENEIKPRAGYHLIRVALDGPAVDQAMRGTVHLSGKAESLFAAMWRRVLQVLVRESSA